MVWYCDPSWRLSAVGALGSFVITFMYTLSPMIVLELNFTQDAKAVGFWSGFLVATFQISRAPAAPIWGWLGDKYGKLKALRISLVLSGLCALMCGFCTSLEYFAALRCLTGLLSCALAMCSALGFEFGGKRGTSIVSSGWSAAKLIGPGLASVLMPISEASRFPFLLPFGALFLLQMLACTIVPAAPTDKVSPEPLLPDVSKGASQPGSPDDTTKPDSKEESKAPAGFIMAHQPPEPSNNAAVDYKAVLCKCFFLNAAIVLIACAMEEIIILYAFGQLDVGSATVGTVYIIAGTLELVLQNTILVKYIASLETADLPRVRRMALGCYAVPFALLPFCVVKGQPWLCTLLLLGFFCGLRTTIGYIFVVTNSVIQNEATRHALGVWNGWASALNSVVQIFGPPLGTVAFAWSATSGNAFPLDHHFTFLCAALAASALAAVA